MFVTTAFKPSTALVRSAKRFAAELDCPYIPRLQMTLPKMRARYGEQPIFLVTDEQLRYHSAGGDYVYFHPSTAAIRVKRLRHGERDPVVELAGIRPGDSVLDCTAGLGSDAITFAYAAGETGRVIALESELALAILLREGLAAYDSDIGGLNEAMRRVRVEHAEHTAYLKSLPDNSVDVVYFDPMFRKPIEQSSAISPLREAANAAPLSEEAVAEARRVARRKVILKESRYSGEFDRLGFVRQPKSNTKIAYGVIEW